MEPYQTIVELTSSLVKCKNKEDRAFIKKMMSDIYEREADGSASRIEEIENKISALTLQKTLS